MYLHFAQYESKQKVSELEKVVRIKKHVQVYIDDDDDDDDDDDESRSCGSDAIHKLRVLELQL